MYESRVLVRGEALALLLGRRALQRGGGARGVGVREAVRDDDLRVPVLARLRDEDARGARLLVDDRREFPEQKLARGDGLGETERQKLRGRGRLRELLFGRVALEVFEELFGVFEVELRAEFAEGVDGESQVLCGARGLRDGVRAAQEVVRAGRSVSVADEFAD